MQPRALPLCTKSLHLITAVNPCVHLSAQLPSLLDPSSSGGIHRHLRHAAGVAAAAAAVAVAAAAAAAVAVAHAAAATFFASRWRSTFSW